MARTSEEGRKEEKKQMGKGREERPCKANYHVKEKKKFKGKEGFTKANHVKTQKRSLSSKSQFNWQFTDLFPEFFIALSFFFIYINNKSQPHK